MGAVTSEVLHALTTCLSAAYTRGLSGVTPQWQRIASEIPSSSASNTYGWMKDLPEIKEWVSARQMATLDGYGYTLANKTWESSIRVKREHIEDDQIVSTALSLNAMAARRRSSRTSCVTPCCVPGLTPCVLTARTSLMKTTRWATAPTATLSAPRHQTRANRGS